jgi:3-phenylpropionate/trans-cinnamate dioxygenase ferredoxin reductase component
MSDRADIVVVGGGHAGVQLCAGLVAAGLGRGVHLVCEEPELPYQRPPLSKAYLKSADEALQLHRAEPWFLESGITVHRADPVLSIDRAGRFVVLGSGRRLGYGQLVLATGTRSRALASLPPGLSNVASLRTAAEAARLRGLLPGMHSLTVLGGGFIGLEVAATARALGKTVRVLEAASRLLMRAVSPELSAHVLQGHRERGIEVTLGAEVGGFEIADGRLEALAVNGKRHAVDTLLLGIGATPEQGLALQAGLMCDNGIVVDAAMRTSDPHILAVGDCTNFPLACSGQRLRLESVQNANDQAKVAVATLSGQPGHYQPVPWFWSEQGSMRLQMAGLVPAGGVCHRRSGTSPSSFSLLHYLDHQLACVESVNAPADHMAAKKLLEAGVNPEPQLACDPARPLKSFA